MTRSIGSLSCRPLAVVVAALLTSSAYGQSELDALLESPSTESAREQSAPPRHEGDVQDSLKREELPAARGDETPGEAVAPAPAERSNASSGASDEASRPTVSPARTIEEIVVTAQKAAQKLQDVPASISTISGELVKDAAITDPRDVARYVPNVSFGDDRSVNIRGLGSPPARNLEPAVGLVLDEVFYGRTTFAQDGLFDLERIEVLRGPQGTLFGNNTVAGVMLATTAEPSFEPRAEATASFDTLDGRRFDGGAGFPILRDVLAARLSLRYREADTDLFNTARDEEGHTEDLAGRIKLRWLVTDTIDLDVIAFASNGDRIGEVPFLHRASEQQLDVYRDHDPEATADPFDGRMSLDAPGFSERNTRSVSLNLVKSVDSFVFFQDLDVHLVGGWAQIDTAFAFDSDFSPIPFATFSTNGPELFEQRSLEIRFDATTAAPFAWGSGIDWIVGFYGLETEFTNTSFATNNPNALPEIVRAGFRGIVPPTPGGTTPGPAPPLPEDQTNQPVRLFLESESRALAGFGQATWRLTAPWSVIAGLRVGHERKTGFHSSQSDSQVAKRVGGQQDFAVDLERSETLIAPKLATSYDLGDDVTVFGNLAQGFKSGGFGGPFLAPGNFEFGPEKALSAEIGAKSRWLDRSLVVNATAFRTEFDDLQLQQFTGTSFATVNAAGASSTGFELDFQWLTPLEFLDLAGNVGFARAVFGDYPCAPTTAEDDDSEPECGTDTLPTPNDDPPPSQTLTGRPLPFAPRWTAAVLPSVRFPLWPRFGLGGRLAVDLLYAGSRFLDVDLDPFTHQDATLRVNTRLAFAQEGGPWALVFNARNLTSVKERTRVFDAPFFPGSFAGNVLPHDPIFTVDVRYAFGG